MNKDPIFTSRRSAVYGKRGMVATSQPLAVAAGLEILAQGGSAADAAVATAAALNVTEPTSTGIGGDCFALFFNIHFFADHSKFLWQSDSLALPVLKQFCCYHCFLPSLVYIYSIYS
jgi:hypothetical protein